MSAEYFNEDRIKEKPKTAWQKFVDWSNKYWYVYLVLAIVIVLVYLKYRKGSDSSVAESNDEKMEHSIVEEQSDSDSDDWQLPDRLD